MNNTISKADLIKLIMMIQHRSFNPKRTPRKDCVYQFTFNENEGVFHYYLDVKKNRTCRLCEGVAIDKEIEVITDIETWNGIGTGTISGRQAMKEGTFTIKGNMLKFIIGYQRIFSGTTKFQLTDGLYDEKPVSGAYKNVLVISGSPRKRKGATQLMVEKLVEGMRQGGAHVDILIAEELKLNECKGCFNCWVNDSRQCIFRDDMDIFWEKFHKADLVVWATPIYIFHVTTAIKKIMDRLFIINDPHITTNKYGKDNHPRRHEHMPAMGLLAVAGYSDYDVFEPLQKTFEIWKKHHDFDYAFELLRTQCMTFINDEEYLFKKHNESFDALIDAGREIIQNKKVSKKTRKKFEQPIMSKKMFIAGANANMDYMLENKKNIFEREDQAIAI